MILQALPVVLLIAGQTPPPQAQQQAPPAVQTPAPTIQRPPPPPTYNPTADARDLIARAIHGAEVDEIRVLINWGANDSEGSRKFTEALRAREITSKSFFSDEYKVAYIDVGHLDKNMDVAATYGVTLTAADLPAITILDAKGAVRARAGAKDFVTAGEPIAFDTKKIADFLSTYQAPPAPDAGPLLQAALARAKTDDKSVFVWFSAPW